MTDAEGTCEAFIGKTSTLHAAAKDRPCYIASRRFKFGVIVFFANILLYLHRVNLNMAIVCMLDATEQSAPEVKNDPRQEHRINVSYNTEIYNESINYVKQHAEYFTLNQSVTNYPHGQKVDPQKDSNTLSTFNDAMTSEGLTTGNDTLMGTFTPAMYTLMMHWTTSKERASVLSFSLSGQPVGIVLAYVTSGLLCAMGWSTIFYVHGGVTLVFMLLWLYEIRNTPEQHPNITQAEKDQLMAPTVKTSKKSALPTPWKSILLSRPQWAATIVNFVFNWSLFTIVINIPLFLKESFAYVITENAFFSALPYVFSSVTWMFSGTLSAAIINKRLLSVQTTRKTLTAISLCGSTVCIILAGHVTYELRFLAVALICVSCIFGGLSFGGYIPSYTEYAGIFSGTAFAISNVPANGAVIISATVAGLMTPNGLQKEWQNVFYLAAGLNIFGGIVYCLFGEATLQEWAKVDKCTDANTEMEVRAETDKDDKGDY